VCGSSQGIGKACAFELASLGASVTLLARDRDTLERVRSELATDQGQSHATLVADFSDLASVSAAASDATSSGPIHVLVNNTGGPPGGRAIDAAPDAYLKAFTMHLLANQTLAQALVPAMREVKYGRIINVISTSVKAPIPGLGVSNTIRGAVASWAKTLAGELGPDGITVNNVLPGFTDTARLRSLFSAKAEKQGTTADAVAQAAIASIPAGRFGEASEIAAAVAFLATPAASYINGINVPVDGGRTQSL